MPRSAMRRSTRSSAARASARAPARRAAASAGYGRRTVSGRGAYSWSKPGPWGRYGRAIGGALGGAVGARLGAPQAGAAIGSAVGSLAHYVGRIFGSGDYSLGQAPVYNSLWKGTEGLKQTKANPFLTFGEKSIRIRHREYLCDIFSAPTASTFQVHNYNISPTVLATFPWLSQIAMNYQQWRPHGIVVEFKSTSGNALNSTNTALGSVIIAPDMNPATFNLAFQNKTEMLNYAGAADGKPSSCIVVGIECDPNKLPMKEYYTRSNGNFVGGVNDIRLTDLCSFGVATSGFQGTNVNIGELYIIYDIELMNPQMLQPGSGNIFARGTLQTSSLVNQVAGTTTAGILGANSTITTVAGNMVLDNYNNTGQPFAHITIADRSMIVGGSVFEFIYGAGGTTATATLGCPNEVTSTGTLIESTANRMLNPDRVITGYQTSVSYRFVVQDPSLLATPTAGKYTPALGYPNSAILCTLTNTGVAGATNSVATSCTFGYFSLTTVAPGDYFP